MDQWGDGFPTFRNTISIATYSLSRSDIFGACFYRTLNSLAIFYDWTRADPILYQEAEPFDRCRIRGNEDRLLFHRELASLGIGKQGAEVNFDTFHVPVAERIAATERGSITIRPIVEGEFKLEC